MVLNGSSNQPELSVRDSLLCKIRKVSYECVYATTDRAFKMRPKLYWIIPGVEIVSVFGKMYGSVSYKNGSY